MKKSKQTAKQFTKYNPIILRGLKLTLLDKLLISYLKGWQDNDKVCYERNVDIAEYFEVNEKSIRRTINKLVDMKLVFYTRSYKDHHSINRKAIILVDENNPLPTKTKVITTPIKEEVPTPQIKEKVAEKPAIQVIEVKEVIVEEDIKLTYDEIKVLKDYVKANEDNIIEGYGFNGLLGMIQGSEITSMEDLKGNYFISNIIVETPKVEYDVDLFNEVCRWYGENKYETLVMREDKKFFKELVKSGKIKVISELDSYLDIKEVVVKDNDDDEDFLTFLLNEEGEAEKTRVGMERLNKLKIK